MKTGTYTRYAVVVGGIMLLLLLAVVANINWGSVDLSPIEILRTLTMQRSMVDDVSYNIVWKIRLPRVLMAAVLGGALSLSGFLLQTFFRNPIAGPFVLGISSGAKMMVALMMIVWIRYFGSVGLFLMVAAAFAGALLATAFVLLMSKKIKQIAMLLVAGIMVGYICSAVTNFVVAFANEYQITNLYTWSMGSFSGASWPELKLASLIVFTVFAVVFLLSKPIGAYQLGEAYALSMGVDIKRFRVVLVVLSSLLSATVTAFAGPISFVGIAVPHMVKMLLKTTKPLVVIPVCFLGGATFTMICDLIARTAFSPTELSISTVTAIFGAPVVISLMLKRQQRGGV